jgi:hypothetical protein
MFFGTLGNFYRSFRSFRRFKSFPKFIFCAHRVEPVLKLRRIEQLSISLHNIKVDSAFSQTLHTPFLPRNGHTFICGFQAPQRHLPVLSILQS